MFAGGRGPRHCSSGVDVRGRFTHDIVLSGRNLCDEEARSHTSFPKEVAPLPGRQIRLTYQVGF